MNLNRILGSQLEERINGLFTTVKYINPYPGSILKSAPCRPASLTMLTGFLVLLFIPLFAFVGQMSEKEIQANQIYTFINHLFIDIAGIIQQERVAAVALLIAVCIELCIICIFVSQAILYPILYRRWLNSCVAVEAILVDSEIQERTVYCGSKGRRKESRWEYRVKVRFDFQEETYEATPGIINRFDSGNVCNLYMTKEKCEQALNRLTDSVQLQVNRSNPLDCEIADDFRKLYKNRNSQIVALIIFSLAVAGFTWMYMYISQHGHTYIRRH